MLPINLPFLCLDEMELSFMKKGKETNSSKELDIID